MALTPYSGSLPQRNDRATFSTRADSWVTWFTDTIVGEIDTAITALNLNDVTGTSTGSATIGTGDITLSSTSTGKSWIPGMWVSVADTAAPSTNAFYGPVKSYSGSTLVVTSKYTQGSGTKSSWKITQSAPSDNLASLVLLDTVTASASSTVDLETTFDSTYQEYLVFVTDAVFSAATMYCRLKLGGAYAATNYKFHCATPTSTAATYAAAASASATDIFITNTSQTQTSFMLRAGNPTSTTLEKTIYWTGSSLNGSGVVSRLSGSGMNTATTALTGIRFYLSTGTITSGEFKLYGVRKS